MAGKTRRHWTPETITPVIQRIMAAPDRNVALKAEGIAGSVALRWARRLNLYTPMKLGKGKPPVEVTQQEQGITRRLSCSQCRRPNLTSADFVRSWKAASGYMGICKKCLGKNIGKSKQANQAKAAVNGHYDEPSHGDSKIALANKALRASGRATRASRDDVNKLIKRFVIGLSTVGVDLESMRVENGKIKTTYRIEEEIDL